MSDSQDFIALESPEECCLKQEVAKIRYNIEIALEGWATANELEKLYSELGKCVLKLMILREKKPIQ